MHRSGNGTRLLGIILVIIGVLWIAHEIGYSFHMRSGLHVWAFMVLGVLIALSGYRQHRRGTIFLGTFISLFSLIELLKVFRVIHPFLVDVWPLYLAAVGIAFLALIPVKPRDFAAAIPGTILILIGLSIFIEINHIFAYSRFYEPGRLWPYLLIIIGSLLLWRGRGQRRSKKRLNRSKEEQSSEPTQI